MDWIYVKNTDGVVITINLSLVQSFWYEKDSDITIIEFARNNYPDVHVYGDITANIRRLLNSHNHYVNQVGG